MKVILLGAPGCGKGTQAAYISNKYGLPHISTGELFRENIKNMTPLGIKVKEVMDSGNLCPDDLTVAMVKDRLSKADCQNGYLLDGFPRNVAQAVELDKIAPPDLLINIDVDFSIIEHRITGRRNCPKCGKLFHVDFIGNVENCPDCGEKLVIRKDDNAETVKERLSVYEKSTAPVYDYYLKQGKAVIVDGSLPAEKVFEQIVKVLG